MTRAPRRRAATRAAKHVARQVATSVAKRQTSAFVRWALRGGVANFVTVGIADGYNKLNWFPANVLVPASGSDAGPQAVAGMLWFAGSAVWGYWRRKRQAGGPPSPVAAAVLLTLGVADRLLGWPTIAWATDGGFREALRGDVVGLPGVIAYSGAVGFVCGLGGWIGERLAGRSGPAVETAPPPDVAVETVPPLIDPDSRGEPLVVNDGRWPDVPVGHVWYGEWLPRDVAAARIRQRQAELARLDAETEASWGRTLAASEARGEGRGERLEAEGFVYDRERDVWRPGPGHPEYEEARRRERIGRELEKLARIEERLPMGEWARIDDLAEKIVRWPASDEEVEGGLRRLVGAVFRKGQARTEAEAAQAEQDAVWYRRAEETARRVQIAAMGAGLGASFAPAAAAVAAKLATFHVGTNFFQGAAEGYSEGGAGRALVRGARSVLPVNTLIAVHEGKGAGEVFMSALMDLGNAMGLREGARQVAGFARARGLAPGGALGRLLGGAEESAHAAARTASRLEGAADTASRSRAATINREWQAARRHGQGLVDDLDALNRRLGAAASEAERAALQRALREKAIEVNSSYQAKAILKAQKRSELAGVMDHTISGVYREVDADTAQRLNDMGFRRGGRPFGRRDVVDLRNATSAGTVGMDRDVALNQMMQRRLQRQLEDATARTRALEGRLARLPPGSEEAARIRGQIAAFPDEAQRMQQGLQRLRERSKLTVDYEQYTGHLRRQLGQAAPGSPQARALAGELQRAQQAGQRYAAEMGRVRALEGQLARVGPGSGEAAALRRQLADAQAAARRASEISPSTWNQVAQRTYNQSYEGLTGRNAEQAYQALTQGANPEAYRDLGVLRNAPVNVPFRKEWADQTASVTSFKTYHNDHLAAHGLITRGDAIQESARGMAKDMNTKLLPLLQGDARVAPEKLEQLGVIRDVLDRVGQGRIPPGHADLVLQQALPHIPNMSLEKARDLITSNLAAGIKWHVPKAMPN